MEKEVMSLSEHIFKNICENNISIMQTGLRKLNRIMQRILNILTSTLSSTNITKYML